MLEKFIVVLLGLALLAFFFFPEKTKKVTVYEPPALSALRSSTGKVGFVPVWKSSGGELTLDVGKDKLVLTCVPPNGKGAYPCWHEETESGARDLRPAVVGKQGTARWEPVDGNVNGRLYQLEVDGKIFVRYEDMAARYATFFKKNQRSDNQ